MSKSPISLLLLRCLTLTPLSPISLLHISQCAYHIRPFSTSSPNPPKPTSLSARMSLVFDQIDAIARERAEKDETLQRIREWRQSKNTPHQNPEIIATQLTNPGKDKAESGVVASYNFGSDLADSNEEERKGEVVELVHPWPEWIELMERLVKQNYFDHRRKDEDKMVRDLGLDVSGVGSDEGADEDDVGEVGVDFSKDIKTVQTACLNFGKDRFDIFRSLSRQDIQILVGYGCPSADKKVVFSAKLLRKHVHLDEGDVCSNCSMRSSCERAYLLTNKEDEARTIDVMRVLLAYGLHPLHGTITNKPLLKQKSVRTVARKLLHEVVKLSAVPIDPNLPPPVIKKPPPKVKQPPPPQKKRVGRDDIEMKKGDWLCPKCDFMNFAKNTVCLQCDAKRPKRQLLPGEWECPECNFLNYRRNMVCFHCECKRPPDEFVEAKMEERQRGLKTKMEKLPSRPEVSNAWNFNFDDDESDGADVAAFEYADSGAKILDNPVDGGAQGETYRGHDTDLNKATRNPVTHKRDHPTTDHVKPGVGFDDFDDEDDIDSYEVDTQSNHSPWKASQENHSRPGISDFEESDGSDDQMDIRPTSKSSSYMKSSRHPNKKAAFSGPEFDNLDTDSDEELSRHPKWRSSHVADTRYKNGGRGGTRGPPRRLSFGSDEEVELDSDEDDDMDDLGSGQWNRKKQASHRSNFRSSIQGNVSFSNSGSDDDLLSGRNKSGGRRMEAGKRNVNFRDRGCSDFGRNSEIKSKGRMTNRRSSWDDDFNDSSRGSYSRANGHSRKRMNDRHGNFHAFKAPRQGRLHDRLGGRPSEHAANMDRNFGEFRNSRRVIER